MPYGLYISAEGAAAQAQRLEVIANNLANVDTAGFKQDVPMFQARFAEAIQRGQATPRDQSINDLGGGVKVAEVETDYSAGTFQPTNSPLDMAINGQGFFHIRGRDGQVCLSRAGNFQLDATGKLVTASGHHPVLDQQNTDIVLAADQPWSVSPDGFVSQAGTLKALGLSQPKSLGDLVKVGDNMFRLLAPPIPVPLSERQVRQGYLEMSGASPVRQMMAMIESTRGFEANARMIQSQDNALGTLISRVLKA